MTTIKNFDPIHIEILKNRLEGISDGMALTVMKSSRSSIVRTALDFSTGILNQDGELIGQGLCLPIHLGGMMPALESCLKRYEDQVRPGDIFITNDPYEGGSHLPDIFLFKPVFHSNILVAYVCAMSHHTDIGGRVAGGNACDSTEIYQEGLRIPPLKLFSERKPNETLFRIIEKAVRVPDVVAGDLMGQIAGLDYGEVEYQKLTEDIGATKIQESTRSLLSYTESMTRQAIEKLPNGEWTYTDYVDDDGFVDQPIPITVTVNKSHDEIHVDFRGTGPQCLGAIQPLFQTTKGMVYAATKTALGCLGFDIPNTAGYFRPVTITAPIGSFVHPQIPAPVAARNLGCIRIFQTMMGAFQQILPEHLSACSGGAEVSVTLAGYHKGKSPWKPWVLVDGWLEVASGAYPNRDGFEGQHCFSSNLANTPAETIEVEIPVMVEEVSLLPDSEGAGEYRGGLGMRKTYKYLQNDTLVTLRSDRMKFSPKGTHGGQSSSNTTVTINHNQQDKENMPSKFLRYMKAGDTLQIDVPGGGGWGDPFKRHRTLVRQDVMEEKISEKRAQSIYGSSH